MFKPLYYAKIDFREKSRITVDKRGGLEYNVKSGGENMDKKQKRSLEQAIASVEMEGFRFTEKDKKLCEALVSGELSIAKFLKDCKAGKLKNYVGG